MRRLILTTAGVLGLLAMPALSGTATACPMCKNANEDGLADNAANLPMAYMYSIIFMLSVPATVLTGFGVGFYRLSKKQQSDPPDQS